MARSPYPSVAPRKVASILNLRPGFLRSVNVALDYADPKSSHHYVVTGFIREVLTRVSSALRPDSTERAWRITGDYGSGKSAFALAYARLAKGQRSTLPDSLRKFLPSHVTFEPVLVTGATESLETSIRTGLADLRRRLIRHPPKLLLQNRPGHDALVALLDDHANYLREKGIADGLLLVLDELGQNLRHAALHPSLGDISLLQLLGEKADRSGRKPFAVLALLHQAIGTYSADLDVSAKREWDKVAGRFKEVVFAHPIEQVVSLVAEMLGVFQPDLPPALQREPRLAMEQAMAVGLYGSAPARESLACEAHRFYPLHPTVLPVLIRLLRRFGQNERSLVGFLSSHEPFGFREFAELHAVGERFYRLPDVYDHFKANLAPSLVNGHAAHWEVIDAAVLQARDAGEPAIEIMKTVGLLNLINDPSILATEALLKCAVGHPDVTQAIHRLRDSASLIHERGSAKGFSLWPHSSVNLENARDQAEEALAKDSVGARAVAARLTPRAVVARRHYIETGNLRHFAVRYTDVVSFVQEFSAGLKDDLTADGQIIVVLSNDESEVGATRKLLTTQREKLGLLTIVGVSSPVLGVAEIVREHRRWEWIKNHVKELAGDVYARGHVTREIKRCANALEKKLYHLVQLRDATNGEASIAWFDLHGAVNNTGAGILPHLSLRCRDVFKHGPKVVNELINRRVTSSAASRARSDLIEALATAADREYLGFDQTKNPPEMAIYRSVLLEGKIHVPSKHGWRIRGIEELQKDDPLQLAPALRCIHDLLVKADLNRCAVPDIFAKLRQHPYGVRDGLMPLLIAIYLAGQWEQTAVYEDGTFIEKPGAAVFQRLAKEPEAFHLQHCSVRGIRLELFNRVASVLNLPSNERPDVLAVIRPLMLFAAKLPEYSLHTERHLSVATRKVRSVILEARDPASLLFAELPRALGFGSFASTQSQMKASDAVSFADALNASVLELRDSLPRLIERVASSILAAFEFNGTIAEFREQFVIRVRALQATLTDPELRVFALRVADVDLGEKQWIESVAAYSIRKAVERWRDLDEDEFHTRVASLASRFARAEAVGFNGAAVDPEKLSRAFRFVLTRPDGREVDQVVRWTQRDDETMEEVKTQLRRLLADKGSAGLAAAAQVVWDALTPKKN